MKKKYSVVFSCMLIMATFGGCRNTSEKQVTEENMIRPVWSIEKAQEWGNSIPWYRGANFNPSTAINQLETWQAETFDTLTIDRELGWAEDIGFNCMRVYLHHLAWEIDKEGFKTRMYKYLSIADKHGIKTIFVIFDDVWNPIYKAGKQPGPKPGIHNSGWVQDPGSIIRDSTGNINEELVNVLEAYVKDILTYFAGDNRILLWDLYNEPGNSGHGNKSLYLLKKVFTWGREVNPSQPLSAGVWKRELTELNKYQLENSDIITYHNYNDEIHHEQTIDTLLKYNRPMICTEYMARTRNSRFDNVMPLLKQHKIGAINWGLVAGKSNTIYAWDTPVPNGSEPEIWFHDIFRTDGTPYDQNEIEIIKSMTEVGL